MVQQLRMTQVQAYGALHRGLQPWLPDNIPHVHMCCRAAWSGNAGRAECWATAAPPAYTPFNAKVETERLPAGAPKRQPQLPTGPLQVRKIPAAALKSLPKPAAPAQHPVLRLPDAPALSVRRRPMPGAARQLPAGAGLQASAWPPSPESPGGADTGRLRGAATAGSAGAAARSAEEAETEGEQGAVPAGITKPPASADGQADACAAASTGSVGRPSLVKTAAPFSRLAEAGSRASPPGGLLAKLCRLTGHKAAEPGPQQTPEQTQEHDVALAGHSRLAEPAVQAVKLALSGLAVDAAEPAAAGTSRDGSPAAQADQSAAASAAAAALAPLCAAEAASPAGMPTSGSAAGVDASNGDFPRSEASGRMPSTCTVRPTMISTHASPPEALRSGWLGQVEAGVGSQAGCEMSAGQLQQAPNQGAAAAAAAAAGSHCSQEQGSHDSGRLPEHALPSGDNIRAGTPAEQHAPPGSLEALDLETGPLPGPGADAGVDPWGLAVELEDDGLAGKPWLVICSITHMQDA